MNGSRMRLVFLGSGHFGLPTLQRLQKNHDLLAVVSQPDRPAGRHRQLTATPIAQWAAQAGLSIIKPENVNEPAIVQQIREVKPDAAVIIAFGQKLSPELVAALGGLAINLHASLLPKYRGAAPINWAILQGETETGVSVISLAQRMDAGLIYAQAKTPIGPTETAGELHDRLAEMGPDLVSRVLEDFVAGRLRGQAQDEDLATKAPKLSKQDTWVNFDAPAPAVAARVHGLTPWPGIKVLWRRAASGQTQEVFLRRVQPDENQAPPAAPGTVLPDACIATQTGSIRLLELQLPGGRVLTIQDFLRGHRLQPGDQLISPRQP